MGENPLLAKAGSHFSTKNKEDHMPKYIELSAQTEVNLSELFSSNKPKEDDAKEEKDE